MYKRQGLRGARVVPYHIHPDMAIVLEVTFGDEFSLSDRESSYLGKGPVLSIGPNYNRKLNKIFIELAKELNISLQKEVEPYPGGTDASVIAVFELGIPVVGLSVPIRYMHTPVEVVDINDLKETVRLLREFILKFDKFKLT